MAVGAAVGNRQASAIVVSGMTLQTQSWLTNVKKIRVRRTVSTVASHAVFRDRGMLIGKRSPILRMATQAELIRICRAQIVSGGPSMWIVAIGATHLPFAQRMMVRQTHLAALRLVAPQAGIIGLPAWLHDRLGFWNHALYVFDSAWTGNVSDEAEARVRFALCVISVRLMAINTADSIRGVRS